MTMAIRTSASISIFGNFDASPISQLGGNGGMCVGRGIGVDARDFTESTLQCGMNRRGE